MLTKIIASVKQRFAPPVITLGRWGNDEKFSRKQRKVDLANEDHCSCDEYIKKKQKETVNDKK